MSFEIGDIIQLGSKDGYIVINDCLINDMEYYMIMNQNNNSQIVIIQKENGSDDVNVIKEENKIEDILKQMSK